MGKYIPTIFVSFLLLTNTGCGIPIGTIRTDVPAKLEYFQSLIKPGTTNRNETRDLLGEPFLSSNKWSLEIYRAAEGKDTDWALVVVLPLPGSEEVILYCVILYDLYDKVREVEWLLYRGDRPPSEITIGDLRFLVRNEDYLYGTSTSEYLFLSDEASKATLLEAAPTDKCRITFGLINNVMQISVDGRSIIDKTPDAMSYGFIQHTVKPGTHEISMKRSPKTTELRSSYTCAASDSHYAFLNTKPISTNKEGFPDRFRHEWEIVITKEPPESILNGFKLIYQPGKWFDDE